MQSFNIIIEEEAKSVVLAKLDSLQKDGSVGAATIAGMKAIVNAIPESHVAIAFNGFDGPSGYCYSSWQGHSDIRDVPNEEEKKMPNEAGYERDEKGQPVGELHQEWEGARTRAMAKRLGREPKM